ARPDHRAAGGRRDVHNSEASRQTTDSWHPDLQRAQGRRVPVRAEHECIDVARRLEVTLDTGRDAVMATQTATRTESERARAGKEKIRQLRELFADAPELGRKALDNVLHELTAQATQPPPLPVESAGRAGVRLGKVSELTIVVPLAPGGAKRL